jgi:putative transposase
MPPDLRNHRVPTGIDTPTAAAASSLESPAAIPAQNAARSSRRATGGLPGDRNVFRVDRAERRVPVVIAASIARVLRRPIESTQYTSAQFQDLLKAHGITCSMSKLGDVWDNAAMESFFSSLKIERIRGRVYRSRDEARADVFDYVERFYNPKRRHSTLGYLSPVDFEKKAMQA